MSSGTRGPTGNRTRAGRLAATAAALAASAALLPLAACGTGSAGGRHAHPAAVGTAPYPAPARGAASASAGRRARAAPAPATVRLRRTPLGDVLVDAAGRTLYVSSADPRGRTECAAACAASWPPLTADASAGGAAPAAGRGVTARLAVIGRPGGGRQVTAGGRPLYTFRRDAAGQIRGQGVTAFGGTWWAVGADGRPVTDQPSGSGAVTMPDDAQNPDGTGDY